LLRTMDVSNVHILSAEALGSLLSKVTVHSQNISQEE